MRYLITEGFLKYIICLLGITIFLLNGNGISFADKVKIDYDNGFFHQDDEEDYDESEGDDDDGEDDDESHNAGRNCLTSDCHSNGNEHHFSVGGTIYTDADGTARRTGAEIKVIDATGTTTILRSDGLGNFYSEKTLNAPFIISALYGGREVKMPIPAPDGGCNAESCHVIGVAGRVFISTNDLDLTGTVTEAASGRVSSEISYNGDIKSILDAKCIICHSSGGIKSDVPLTTYTEVTDPRLVIPGSADSLLLKRVDKNSSIGTMWKYLNSRSDYKKMKKWIVKYNAQEFSSGQVSSVGEAISAARVSLRQNGSVRYKTVTDAEGTFVMKSVKAGEYILKISKKGYKTYKQSYQMNQSNVIPLEITIKKK
ncbi:MAG: carboxypeptidase-like regulatory domain-containing protein [Candidatus Brocadia sinica]|nr:carboxypeptidase-like regulatory domain-containing protein [Candidatus Brocadia sinica]NUO04216.1 carboxypeptidase regulatory-like domain-containing protein [Candidatus Brocadia sinica]